MPKQVRKFFIPFYENKDIIYKYIFCLYKEAVPNTTKVKGKLIYDTIKYKSEQKLTDNINDKYIEYCKNKDRLNNIIKKDSEYKGIVSKSSISKIIKNENYKDYFKIDKINKTITLNNNIENIKRYVVLNENEVNFLLEQNENLLSVYYIYLKYYCGKSKDKTTDNTISQFLETSGYCDTSGANKEKIGVFNKLLEENNLIKIERYKDDLGYNRNRYKIVEA